MVQLDQVLERRVEFLGQHLGPPGLALAHLAIAPTDRDSDCQLWYHEQEAQIVAEGVACCAKNRLTYAENEPRKGIFASRTWARSASSAITRSPIPAPAAVIE